MRSRFINWGVGEGGGEGKEGVRERETAKGSQLCWKLVLLMRFEIDPLVSYVWPQLGSQWVCLLCLSVYVCVIHMCVYMCVCICVCACHACLAQYEDL